MGTPLGSKYIPYTYMDPLGYGNQRTIKGKQISIQTFTVHRPAKPCANAFACPGPLPFSSWFSIILPPDPKP